MDMRYTLGRLHSGFPVSLSPEERRPHIDIVGQSGSGKSTLLFNLMMSDLASGRGFVLIDPHGDLSLQIADAVPRRRTNDVVYFDPLDHAHTVGFNPLSSSTEAALLTAHIVASFKHIWQDSWGPRLEYILTNSLRLLLAARGATLIDLPRLLVDDNFRSALIAKCDDPIISLFWRTEFAGYGDRLRAEAIAPIQNKIGQLAGNPTIKSILGQPSTIDIPCIINTDKILICNLSKRMGEEPSHLLGALLVNAIAQAAQDRASLPETSRRDFTLYVDEFQNFATESFASILSEMRKWRLNLVIANQFLGQVPDLLRQSIFGNAGTLVVFRAGAEDAEMLAAQLGHPNPTTLTDTPNYAAWVKTMRDGSPTRAEYLSTLPPARHRTGRLPAIVARTRARPAAPGCGAQDRRRLHRRPRAPPQARLSPLDLTAHLRSLNLNFAQFELMRKPPCPPWCIQTAAEHGARLQATRRPIAELSSSTEDTCHEWTHHSPTHRNCQPARSRSQHSDPRNRQALVSLRLRCRGSGAY